MKKTIITLLLIFSLSIEAQQQFEGSWTSGNSSHTTVIITSEYAVLKVFNFSFEEDSYIEEEIIKQDNKNFTTRLEASIYCTKFLPKMDNCLIVDTTKF